MSSRYYYCSDAGQEMLSTRAFYLGRPITDYLCHRNSDSSDMLDLIQAEYALGATHKELATLANTHCVYCEVHGHHVPRDLFEGKRFSQHFMVKGTPPVLMERQLSALFTVLVALCGGLEDRMARLTIRLKERDERLWTSMPARGKKKIKDQAGTIREQLRENSGLNVARLKELTDTRNRAIHERAYFPHVVFQEDKADILFSPAVNHDELCNAGYPEHSVTKLGTDVKFLIEDYLAWWLKESVTQIRALA